MSDQDATTRDGHRLDTSERRAANSEQGGEQMPMPVRCDARKGKQGGGAAGRTRAFLETARASSKPAQESYGAERGERTEREAPKSVRQHFVLSTRDPFFFVVAFLL